MAKVRLGVALVVPRPFDVQIDVLRKSLGDGALSRIMPHITLVAPVNVAEDSLPDALNILRSAAQETSPITVSLGPVNTFSPLNPVIYLEANPYEEIAKLRKQVSTGVLEKKEDYDFVPHSTLCDEASDEKIAGALVSLTDVNFEFVVDRVHLLRKDTGAPWEPIADFLFDKRVVGTGGLPITIEISENMSPEIEEFAEREWQPWLNTQLGPNREVHHPMVIAARRENEIVGILRAEFRPPYCYIRELLLGTAARGQGIAAHLLAAVEDIARRNECNQIAVEVLENCEAEHYLRHKGFADDTETVIQVFDRNLVRLHRKLVS